MSCLQAMHRISEKPSTCRHSSAPSIGSPEYPPAWQPRMSYGLLPDRRPRLPVQPTLCRSAMMANLLLVLVSSSKACLGCTYASNDEPSARVLEAGTPSATSCEASVWLSALPPSATVLILPHHWGAKAFSRALVSTSSRASRRSWRRNVHLCAER